MSTEANRNRKEAKKPMARVWIRNSINSNAATSQELEADRYVVDAGTPPLLRAAMKSDADKTQTMLVRFGDAAWALLAAPHSQVKINSRPLPTGIHMLADKDEILVGASRLFFSTERIARVEPFPGAARRTVCPRCQLPLEKDQPGVRCPQCGVWHHQMADRPCWTYDTTCASDRTYPTNLDQTSDLWSPEEL